MNLLNSKIVKSFTRVLLFVTFSVIHVSVKAWEVDMSRRDKELKNSRMPASIVDSPATEKQSGMLTNFFESLDPAQEIVVLNTERGFVPETLKLKKGQTYKLHIVNVNEKEKNTSFILDAFSEHHATFYGQEQTFSVAPKTDGIFSFQCPETAKQGRIIVYSESNSGPERVPASR